jgi:hypothetical protein
MCEHMKRRSKRGKFDLEGAWMMLSIRASVSSSNFVNFANLCVLCLCCHKSQNGGEYSEHGPIFHLFELILVIHANTSNETNHFVEHVFVGIFKSHGCYHMLTYHDQVNIPCPS